MTSWPAMGRAIGWFVVWLMAIELVTVANAQPPVAKTRPTGAKPRWAILSAERTGVIALGELLTVELSKWPDLELVERDALRAVLDEMKLNASGLVAADRGIELGRLAAADVLVLIEPLPKLQPPLTRLLLLEVRTGVRLLDAICPAQRFDAELAVLLPQLRGAISKTRLPDEERHYVSVLGVRNEEPGNTLTPLAQALTVFLEHDLRLAPGVLVLERGQLGRLTAEKELTGIDLKLRSSSVMIELGLRREAGQTLAIAGELKSLDGKPAKRVRLTVPHSEPTEIRTAIAKSVIQALGAPPANPNLENVSVEAEIFERQSHWLLQNGRPDDAVRTAEAAVALHPHGGTYAVAYRAHTHFATRGEELVRRIANDFVRTSRAPPPELVEQVAAGLAAALRAHELDLANTRANASDPSRAAGVLASQPAQAARKEILQKPSGAGGSPPAEPSRKPNVEKPPEKIQEKQRENQEGRDLKSAPRAQSRILRILGTGDPFLPRIPTFPNEPEEHQRLRSEIDELCWQKYQVLQETAKRQGDFAIQFPLFKMLHADSLATSAERYCQLVLDIQEEIELELVRDAELMARKSFANSKSKQERSDWPRRENFKLLCQQVKWTCEDRSSDAWQHPNWPRASLTPLWTALSRHSDPLVRIPGLYGLSLLAGPDGERAAHAVLDLLDKLPDDVGLQARAGDVPKRAMARLQQDGELDDFIERLITRAEQEDSVAPLLRWPVVFGVLLSYRSDPKVWHSRLRKIVERASSTDVDPEAVSRLREQVSIWSSRFSRAAPDSKSPWPLTGLWSQYTARKLEFIRPEKTGRIRGAALVGDPKHPSADEQLVVAMTLPKWVYVGRMSADGGPMAEIGRVEVRSPPSLSGLRVHAPTPDLVFIGTAEPSLVMVAGGQLENFGVAEGLPGNGVGSMAWLDDVLYFGISNGLATFDPRIREFRILASSLAVTVTNPLDAGEPYFVEHLLADPDNHCLWMNVKSAIDSPRTGVWKFTPSLGNFRRMDCVYAVGLTWDGDKVLYLGRDWTHIHPSTGLRSTMPPICLGRGMYREPRILSEFIRTGRNLAFSNRSLLTPEGAEHYQGVVSAEWRLIGPVKNGFLIRAVNSPDDGIWRFERSSTQ